MTVIDAAERDRGAVSLFVVVLFIALLAAAGLVVDGDAKLRAAREASAIAEESARAGAGRVNVNRAYAHGGHFTIARNAAAPAARTYLASTGHTGTVAIAGTRQIRVTVTISKRTTFLVLIGITEVHVTQTASARLVPGIDQPTD